MKIKFKTILLGKQLFSLLLDTEPGSSQRRGTFQDHQQTQHSDAPTSGIQHQNKKTSVFTHTPCKLKFCLASAVAVISENQSCKMPSVHNAISPFPRHCFPEPACVCEHFLNDFLFLWGLAKKNTIPSHMLLQIVQED